MEKQHLHIQELESMGQWGASLTKELAAQCDEVESRLLHAAREQEEAILLLSQENSNLLSQVVRLSKSEPTLDTLPSPLKPPQDPDVPDEDIHACLSRSLVELSSATVVSNTDSFKAGFDGVFQMLLAHLLERTRSCSDTLCHSMEA
jgi:hypothetical protein